MPNTTATKYTVHGVLAGAYRGRDISERTLLSHASVDGGDTAICSKRVANLADVFGTAAGQSVTCPACAKKIARLGLVESTDV